MAEDALKRAGSRRTLKYTRSLLSPRARCGTCAPLVQRLGYEPSKLETRVRLPDGAFSAVAHCTLVPWIFLFLAKTIDSTAAPGTSQSQQVARTHKCCIWRSVNNFVYNAVHIAPSFIALSPVSQCRDLLFFVFYCAR